MGLKSIERSHGAFAGLDLVRQDREVELFHLGSVEDATGIPTDGLLQLGPHLLASRTGNDRLPHHAYQVDNSATVSPKRVYGPSFLEGIWPECAIAKARSRSKMMKAEPCLPPLLSMIVELSERLRIHPELARHLHLGMRQPKPAARVDPRLQIVGNTSGVLRHVPLPVNVASS
jgi:hypothetical protein